MHAPEPLRPTTARLALLGLALVLLGSLIYGRALSGAFVYDDLRLIVGNPRVTGEAGLLRSIFGSFWGFDGDGAEGLVGYWRPVTIGIFRATSALGLGALAFHIVSLLVHLAAGLAVWRLASKILSSENLGLLAGAVFLAHPVNVEAVAWASSLSDPLCGLFAILAMLGLSRWRECDSKGLPWLTLASFALCLGSKEQGLTLLLLLFVFDALIAGPCGKTTAARSALRIWGGLAVVAALYYCARVFVFGDMLAGFERFNADLGMGLGRAMWFRVEALGAFLGALLGFNSYELFRPFHPAFDFSSSDALLAVSLVLGWLVATLLAARKNGRVPLFALLIVPITLSPILINPNAAGQFPISDRYMYTAVFAASLAGAWALGQLHKSNASLGTPALGLVLVLGMAILSFLRTAVWQSEEALFRQTVLENPANPFGHWSLGRVLLAKHLTGIPSNGEEDSLQEAHLHFLVSLNLASAKSDGETWRDPGALLDAKVQSYEALLTIVEPESNAPVDSTSADTIWISKNDRQQALLGHGYAELYLAGRERADFGRAIAIFETAAQSHGADYRVLIAQASAQLAQGGALRGARSEQFAMQAFHASHSASAEAKTLAPTSPEAWSIFARASVALGEWELAVQAFERARKLRTNDSTLTLDLARCHIESGRPELAPSLLDSIPTGDLNYIEGRNVLALMHARQGNYLAAVDAVDKLLVLQPNHPAALLTKAKSQLALGDKTAALSSFQLARKLNPSSFEAHYAVASLLLQAEPKDAFAPLREAYLTSPPGGERTALQQQLMLQVDVTVPMYLELIGIAQQLGESDHAASFIQQATKQHPTWDGGAVLLRSL